MQYAITQAVGDLINRLRTREEGQGLVEYGLILVLVSLATVATLTAIGGQLNTVFTAIQAALASA